MKFPNLHLACIVILAIVVASCGPSKAPTAEAATIEAINTPTFAPPPHHYDQEDRGIYYYVASISEEEQKKGKVAGEALGFRYLGKNEKGEHIIESVSDNGTALGRSYCSEPCRVIRRSSGRIGFNPASIIGAAFEDAVNGHLQQFDATKGRPANASSQTEKPSAEARPDGQLSTWFGRYTGSFEGGADGDVTISSASGGRLEVSIGLGGDNCAGGIEGIGVLNAGKLMLDKPRDDSGHQCRVALVRRGDRIDVSEEGCSYFHGAFCSFNGSVRRQ